MNVEKKSEGGREPETPLRRIAEARRAAVFFLTKMKFPLESEPQNHESQVEIC